MMMMMMMMMLLSRAWRIFTRCYTSGNMTPLLACQC
jgi:hypothetical protein